MKTCDTIKADGYWCSRAAVVVVNGHGYCGRHAARADGKAYPPVAKKAKKAVAG